MNERIDVDLDRVRMLRWRGAEYVSAIPVGERSVVAGQRGHSKIIRATGVLVDQTKSRRVDILANT